MFVFSCLVFCAFLFICVSSEHDRFIVEDLIPELKYLNWSVNPCDNFYEFTCGNFGKFHPLPPDKTQWDHFSILQLKIDKITNEILSSKKRHSDLAAVKKAKDMYSACMNEDFNNFIDLKPMANVIQNLGGWSIIQDDSKNHRFSWQKIGKLIGEYGLNFLINIEILPFWLDANETMILIGEDTLSLPSAIVNDQDAMNDYLAFSAPYESNKPYPYVEFLETIAMNMKEYIGTWVDNDYIKKSIQKFIGFAVKIKETANNPLNLVFTGSAPPTTIEELQSWSDSFGKNFKKRINWLSFFRHAFRPSGAKITKHTNVFMSDMNAIANVLRTVEETPDTEIFNFVTTRLMTYMAPDTSMDMWREFNKLCTAQNITVYPRWQYCVRKTTSYPYIGMSLAVTHEYQKYYFNDEKIGVASVMTEDLKAAFLDLLVKNQWMDEDSKQQARFKLSKMLMLIGFPDVVKNSTELDHYYDKLRVCKYDHAGNIYRLRVFNLAKNFALIGKPRDRTLWSQSPMYANAFYNQLNNRMLIPSGIMNTPFYTGNLSTVDYARIGAIIGHEITHGFDNKGKNTDADGTIATHTWSNETLQAFNKKADCIRKQYSKYHINEIDQNVDGQKTLGENIADNGGLREAFYAFQKLSARQTVQTVKNFTKEQLFFVAYGTMWCKIDTPISLEIMHKKDVHSPNRFRVIGTTSNMMEFAEAFKCPSGSKMNPVDKCILW